MSDNLTNKNVYKKERINMSALWYISHSIRMSDTEQAYINAEWDKYFRGIKSFKNRMIFKLDNKESEDLDKILRNAIQNLQMANSKQNTNKNLFLNRFLDLCQEVNNSLLRVMYKNNMIFPEIEVPEGLKGIEKRLGISD